MNTAHNSLQPLPQSQNKSPRTPQSLARSRLRKHADFQRAYAVARKRQSASMSWFLALRAATDSSVAPEEARRPRVGLTVGKAIGKAHERNRIKRRVREALRRNLELLPQGCDLILHPRRSVLTLEFAKLEEEIVRILKQASAEAARIRSIPRGSVPPAAAS